MATQTLTIKLGMTGLAQVRAGLSSITTGLATLAAPIAAIAGVGGLTAALTKAARVGVEFNSQMEQAKLGLAAVQRQLNPTTFRNFDEAMTASAEAIELLKQKAKESPASVAELISGFQAMTGAATASGISLRNQIELTVLMSQAIAGLGIETRQIMQESRALLTGNIDQNALVARILGISKPDIDRAKEAGRLFEFLTDKLAAFGEAGRRSTGTMAVMFSNLKDSLEQASAAAFEPVFETIKTGLNAALAVDWTSLGNQMAGWFDLGLSSWKDGQFSNFIALNIEAGFELGVEAGGKMFRRFAEWLGTAGFWKDFLNGFVTFGNSVARGLVDLLAPFVALPIKVSEEFRHAFELVSVSFQLSLTGVINWFAEKIEALLRRLPGQSELSLGRAASPDISVTPAKTWEESMEKAKESGRILKEFLSSGLEDFRNMIGTGELNTSTGALKRLTDLIDKTRNPLGNTFTDSGPGGKSALDATVAAKSKEVSLLELERDLKAELSSIEGQLAVVRGSYRITEAEKFRAQLDLYRQERDELTRIVTLLQDRAAASQDPAEREQILTRLDRYNQQIAGVDNRMAGMGADPNSTSDQMLSAITDLQNEFGTVAQGIARSFKSVIGTAVDSVSGGLQKLIGDTEYWSSKLGNIAGPIMGAITASISRMFTEWIVQRGLAAAKNIFFSTQEGTADTAAKAPGAMMTSISTLGIAAAVGGAAFLAAMALTGGFKTGGYTGDGGINDVAGVVHGREFVFDAPTVQRIGLPRLEAMQAGADPSSVMGAGGGGNVTIAAFDSRQDARRWAQTQDAEVWFVDMANRTAHRRAS